MFSIKDTFINKTYENTLLHYFVENKVNKNQNKTTELKIFFQFELITQF